MITRVVQFSDTHLRTGHGRHQRGFSRAVSRAGPADLALVTGDLSVDGADREEDLWAARARFEALGCPVHVIPGNHDIGEEPASPGQRQPITPERRARFLAVFGEDRFEFEVPGWRLVGLNVHLFGTGWEAEAEQWRALEDAVEGRGDQRVGVFVHKPLFIDATDEPEQAYWCVPAPARDRLLAIAEGGAIAFFSSGHLHQGLLRKVAGVQHVWTPATANAAQTARTTGVFLSTGAAIWTFQPGRFHVAFAAT